MKSSQVINFANEITNNSFRGASYANVTTSMDLD